jgi:tripartite-type tricarboxylate transporter receptor subunit TctC
VTLPFWRLVLALIALCLACGSADAQDGHYPSKLVRIIIPYPPGGSADAMARPLANELAHQWNTPVIIDNKPGAGTTLGAAFVAAAQADGYTLYLAATSHAISASLYKSLSYDAVKGFAPVSTVATSPFFLMVNPDSGIGSVAELVARAKAKPGQLNYGSSGVGAGPHLAAEIFAKSTGIQVVHIPFRGAGPLIIDLMGNRLDYIFVDATAVPTVQSGKLKALAVTTAERYSVLPDVPAMREALGKDFDVVNWGGLLAPAGTPPDIVAFVAKSVAEALTVPAVIEAYRRQGYEVRASSPAAFAAFLAAEVDKYRAVIQAANIQPE